MLPKARSRRKDGLQPRQDHDNRLGADTRRSADAGEAPLSDRGRGQQSGRAL
jgi:hypothetical protein